MTDYEKWVIFHGKKKITDNMAKFLFYDNKMKKNWYQRCKKIA